MSCSVATCRNFWRLQRRAYGATIPNGTPNLQPPLVDTNHVCAHTSHALGLSLRGLPDQARRTVERALLLAESLPHPPSIAFAYKWAGSCLMIACDRHGCER